MAFVDLIVQLDNVTLTDYAPYVVDTVSPPEHDNNTTLEKVPETLDAVKEMYDLLGIRGYDRERLATYYNHWYNKIEEIKYES